MLLWKDEKMRKILALILAVILCLSLAAGAFAEENPLNVKEEGFTFEREGCYAKVAWCKEGDAPLFF